MIVLNIINILSNAMETAREPKEVTTSVGKKEGFP